MKEHPAKPAAPKKEAPPPPKKEPSKPDKKAPFPKEAPPKSHGKPPPPEKAAPKPAEPKKPLFTAKEKGWGPKPSKNAAKAHPPQHEPEPEEKVVSAPKEPQSGELEKAEEKPTKPKPSGKPPTDGPPVIEVQHPEKGKAELIPPKNSEPTKSKPKPSKVEVLEVDDAPKYSKDHSPKTGHKVDLVDGDDQGSHGTVSSLHPVDGLNGKEGEAKQDPKKPLHHPHGLSHMHPEDSEVDVVLVKNKEHGSTSKPDSDDNGKKLSVHKKSDSSEKEKSKTRSAIPPGYHCVNFSRGKQAGMEQWKKKDIRGNVWTYSVHRARYPELPTAYLSHTSGKRFSYSLDTGKNGNSHFHVLVGFAEIFKPLCSDGNGRIFHVKIGDDSRTVNVYHKVGCGHVYKVRFGDVEADDGKIEIEFEGQQEHPMVSVVCFMPSETKAFTPKDKVTKKEPLPKFVEEPKKGVEAKGKKSEKKKSKKIDAHPEAPVSEEHPEKHPADAEEKESHSKSGEEHVEEHPKEESKKNGFSEKADPDCSTGVLGSGVCCPNSCGKCGGKGCGLRKGGSDCCTSTVKSLKRKCTEVGPPCTMTKQSKPKPSKPKKEVSEEIIVEKVKGKSKIKKEKKDSDEGEADPDCTTGVSNGNYCCPSSCSKCGGKECGLQKGGSDCCTSTILALKRKCSEVGPPCVLEDVESIDGSKDVDEDTHAHAEDSDATHNGVQNAVAEPVSTPSNSTETVKAIPITSMQDSKDSVPGGMHGSAGSGMHGSNVDGSKQDVVATIDVTVGSKSNAVGAKDAGSNVHGSNIGASESNMHGSGKNDVTPAVMGNATESADPKCSKGVANKNVCCPASCGKCGGSGCASREGGQKCCTSHVKKLDRKCSDVAAPCVMTEPAEDAESSAEPSSAPSPGTSIAAAESNIPESASVPAEPSAVPTASISVGASVSPSPAKVDIIPVVPGETNSTADPTCSNGVADKKFCCPASCGKCGQSGCASREGGQNCCTAHISKLDRKCSEVGPPCIMENDTSSTMPSAVSSVAPSLEVTATSSASEEPSQSTSAGASNSVSVSPSFSPAASISEETDELSASPEPGDGEEEGSESEPGFVVSVIPGFGESSPSSDAAAPSQSSAPVISTGGLSAIPQPSAGTASGSNVVSVTIADGNESGNGTESNGNETDVVSAIPQTEGDASDVDTELISLELPPGSVIDGSPSDTTQVLRGVTKPDPECANGIRHKNSCCPKSCGQCGGPGCSARPGGSSCCTEFISLTNRTCDAVGAPCAVNTTATSGTAVNVVSVASMSASPSTSVDPSASSSAAPSASSSASVSASPSTSTSVSASASSSVSPSVSATPSSSVSPSASVSPSPVPPTSKTGSSVIITSGDESGSASASYSPSPAPGINGIPVDPEPVVAPLLAGQYSELVGTNRDNSSVFAVVMGVVGSLLVLLLIGCLYLAITGGKHAASSSQVSRRTPYNNNPSPGGSDTGLEASSGYHPMPMGYADDDVAVAAAPPGQNAVNSMFTRDINQDDGQNNAPAYDENPTGFSDLAPMMETKDPVAEGDFGAAVTEEREAYGPSSGDDRYGETQLDQYVDHGDESGQNLGFNAAGAFGATLDTGYDQAGTYATTADPGYDATTARPYDDTYAPGDSFDGAGSNSYGRGSVEEEGETRGYEDDDEGYGLNPIPPSTGLSAPFNASAFGYERENGSYSESGSDRGPPLFGKTSSQKVRDQLADIHHQIAQQLSDRRGSQSSVESQDSPRRIPQVHLPEATPSQSGSETRDITEEVVPEQAGPAVAKDPWPFWYNAPRAGPHASVYNPHERVARGASLGGPELLASVRERLMSAPPQPEIIEQGKESDGDSSWIARRDSSEESKPKKEVTFRDELVDAPTLADRWPHAGNESFSSGGDRYEDAGSTSTRTGSGGSSNRPPLVERFNQGMLRPTSGSKSASMSSTEAPNVSLGPVGSAPYVPADLTKNRFSKRFGHQSGTADPVIPTDVNELRQRREPHVKEVAKRLSAASTGTTLTQSSLQSNIR